MSIVILVLSKSMASSCSRPPAMLFPVRLRDTRFAFCGVVCRSLPLDNDDDTPAPVVCGSEDDAVVVVIRSPEKGSVTRTLMARDSSVMAPTNIRFSKRDRARVEIHLRERERERER